MSLVAGSMTGVLRIPHIPLIRKISISVPFGRIGLPSLVGTRQTCVPSSASNAQTLLAIVQT